jgi:hypothetical protein
VSFIALANTQTLVSADQGIVSQTVIVTGIGIDETSAVKNAARSATEQVVGTYVISDTLMKNRKIIQDEVLSHSNAFIKSYEVLDKRKNEDGLFEIKAKIVVESKAVIQNIRDLGIPIKDISNTGEIIARIETNKQARRDMSTLLDKILIEPILNGKDSIWKVNVQSYTQDVKHDPFIRYANKDEMEKGERGELVAVRVFFNVKLDQRFLKNLLEAMEFTTEGKLKKWYRDNKNEAVFLVYDIDFAKLDWGDKSFKLNNGFIFRQAEASVMNVKLSTSSGENKLAKLRALLIINLINENGEVYKSAIWTSQNGLVQEGDRNFFGFASTMSGSEHIELFNQNAKDDYERFTKRSWCSEFGACFGNYDTMMGLNFENRRLSIISKNDMVYSATIYFSSEDAKNLKSIQVQMIPWITK